MRVLIVDDEAAARQRLETMLDELDVEVVGSAENGVQALEMASQRSPDVLLLDIVMPEIDGFDVARSLAEPRPLIIFQTAHDEHALRAFEHEAIDYVVKPVTLSRLAQAIERVRRRLAASERPVLPHDLLARFAAATGVPPAAKTRLLVRDRGGHRLLALRDVDRFSTAQGAVYAHSGSDRFLTDFTLAEIEERTAGRYIRCSRSDLVNIDRIRRIAGHSDGSATITLADGTAVRVSRRRAGEVRTAIAS